MLSCIQPWTSNFDPSPIRTSILISTADLILISTADLILVMNQNLPRTLSPEPQILIRIGSWFSGGSKYWVWFRSWFESCGPQALPWSKFVSKLFTPAWAWSKMLSKTLIPTCRFSPKLYYCQCDPDDKPNLTWKLDLCMHLQLDSPDLKLLGVEALPHIQDLMHNSDLCAASS